MWYIWLSNLQTTTVNEVILDSREWNANLIQESFLAFEEKADTAMWYFGDKGMYTLNIGATILRWRIVLSWDRFLVEQYEELLE